MKKKCLSFSDPALRAALKREAEETFLLLEELDECWPDSEKDDSEPGALSEEE